MTAFKDIVQYSVNVRSKYKATCMMGSDYKTIGQQQSGERITEASKFSRKSNTTSLGCVRAAGSLLTTGSKEPEDHLHGLHSTDEDGRQRYLGLVGSEGMNIIILNFLKMLQDFHLLFQPSQTKFSE